jgi:hypothetical protein
LRSIEVQEEDYDEDDDYNQEDNVKQSMPLKTITNNDKNARTNVSANTNGKKSNKPSSGGLFSSFKSLVGGKTLTQESISPVMEKMQEHLVCK